MDLYKIVSQLSEEDYSGIYKNLEENKAEKSAAFLKIIRENPETPDKTFLQKFDIGAAAFYVLKSRLNQRVEEFIINQLGDPGISIMHRVLNSNELIFQNTREISTAALRRLERELQRLDFPYGLMIVYRELQNLNAFNDDQQYYKNRYSQQVAYSVAMDKAAEIVTQFFRSYDLYYMGRKDRDLQEMVRQMEKIDNVCNINHESHRLYIYKAIVHIFAKLFVEIPDTIRCEIEDTEVMFEKAIHILDTYKDDTFYNNINILFNFLRYVHYDRNHVRDKARIYFEILDYKIEELLTRFHCNANTSLFLFNKLHYHVNSHTINKLVSDVDVHLSSIEVDTYRLSFYLNFNLFQAYAYFLDKNYRKTSKLLYNLRNDVNLRKHTHADLEIKFFLALTYVMMEDYDLANQLILSLQRQLRKNTMARYEHAKILLKILSVALGGKVRTRPRNLKINIDKWKEVNRGRYALLPDLDLEGVFLSGEVSRIHEND
ncbi:MAG: hypothetical protein SF053_21585 [Bacteroidia bacterium]|nr:hypothetical protein [Bacteroidia bacterium]